MMESMSDFVRVINRTGLPKPIQGRFDGKDYSFQKDKPVDIPLAAAQHIFDFGKRDKSQALARLGWAHTSSDLEDGLSLLGKVVFEEMPEMIEAPRGTKSKRHKETGTAGPPVTAGGTKGGDDSPPEGPDDEDGGEDEKTF